MISSASIYKFLVGLFMICFLFGAIGFVLAYFGDTALGWKIGFLSAIGGNLIIVAFWVIKFFGRHFKFIKFNDR